MARKSQGPRQPLSQRRPKVAAGRKAVAPRGASPNALRGAGKPSKPKPQKKRGGARRPPASPAVVYDRLLAQYPTAHCELDFQSPFELIVATILSAQCTDRRVNMVTPILFARYPTPQALAAAKQEDVE